MSIRARFSLVVAALGCLAGLLSGCPGELEDPERFGDTGGGATGCDAMVDIIEPTCGASSCHDDSDPAAGLDLISPDVGERLVGVEASCSNGLADSGCDCGLRLLVPPDPNEIDGSYFMEKLTSSVPACDDQMPLLLEPLEQAQIDCIRTWLVSLIEEGQ